MKISIKDRVKLKKSNRSSLPGEKGTVVKVYTKRGASTTTVGVLWDSNWPDGANTKKYRAEPGHLFYYKEDDLKIVDSWRV